eukprot:scaffold197631_cov12-Tisochrysis_lutea.AAC.1
MKGAHCRAVHLLLLFSPCSGTSFFLVAAAAADVVMVVVVVVVVVVHDGAPQEQSICCGVQPLFRKSRSLFPVDVAAAAVVVVHV